MSAYSNRKLYGGAITCDIPSDYMNVDDIRQVPDHQECFQSIGDKPVLLVIEILGREEVSNEDAAQYFFNDLAESNGVPPEHYAFQTIGMPNVWEMASDRADTELLINADDSQIVQICAGIGFQKQIAMGRDFDEEGNSRQHLQELQTIRIDLIVLRLVEQETDLLLTLSTPMETSDVPAEFPAIVPTSAMNEIILKAVSSMKIEDWRLFG